MKKIGLICLSLILALGTLGIAYASWTDQVTIVETVSTGEVLVGIVDLGTDDDGTHGQPGDPDSYFAGNLDPGWQNDAFYQYDKNVASCVSTNGALVVDAAGNEVAGYHISVTETLDNVYPSYAPTINIEIKNLGTIPVILTNITSSSSADPDGLTPFVELISYEIQDAAGNVLDSGSGWACMIAWLGNGLLQIEPGDTVTLYLTKHILQDVGQAVCPEGASVTITEVLHFVQWNEAP